jgi:DNA (cytosine-5)-methyltransferase 1
MTKTYTSIELFAGAGGLALGLEKAGLHHILLNEIDKHAAATLRKNRPSWNVVCQDIQEIDFSPYRGVDLVTGGFPCQAFSYAGKKRGLEDTRGTLFYEFARALKESDAKVFLAENVRGLLSHDGGNTIKTIISVFEELGYHVYEPKLLKAIHHQVPQKRERIFIVGVKKAFAKRAKLTWPTPSKKIYTLKDALKKGELFPCDVPNSQGQMYPEKKKRVLDLVPAGGYWRDLPLDVQKAYMQKSFYLGGGKTGIARRIAWDEPSLTLTCSPAQKQTERCHPEETRPFQVREYARIQTFPDEWEFEGSLNQQYKQIGNAVPVNLAEAIGKTLIDLLDSLS